MGDTERLRKRLLFLAITALGISSIITQLTVIREFLSVFNGNELVFGIILANWLLLTGMGSYLGKYIEKIKQKLTFLVICQLAIAFLPFFHIYLIRALRNVLFVPGLMISLVDIIFYSFVLLLPYCVVSGFLLVLYVYTYSTRRDAAQIGKVYFLDNIGDIIGGFLFSFILIYFLNPFQMAFFIMLLNLAAAIMISSFIRRRFLGVFVVLLLIVLTIFFLTVDLNTLSTKKLFKDQELVYQRSSPYGNVVVTRTRNQFNFFENGVPLFTTENVMSNEEVVHYAMVQADNPKSVLLVSGGVAGTIGEIAKYNVERIDYVELDPLIISLGKRYTTNLDNEKLNIVTMDGRLFAKQTNNKYDVVIVDLPDPTTAQLNRFYTIEFFEDVKRILNDKGIVSMSLSSSANYMSDEEKKLNSALYRTLKAIFSNVVVIPGDKNFYIASDKELSYKIAQMIESKDIKTKYVNSYYLKGKITRDRVDYVLGAVKEEVPLNRDFKPVSYYYQLLFWISHFNLNLSWVLIVLVVFLVTLLIRIKPIPFAILTTGFAGASLEFIIIIGFQILYGYVYHKIGVIITLFMLGLALGAFFMNSVLDKRTRRDLAKIEFTIAAYSVLLPVILIALSSVRNKLFVFLSAQIIFPVVVLVIAFLVGAEFPLASKLYFKKVEHTAGVLYSSDLLGACVGALLVSALLVPLLGIVKVCVLIGLLNVVSGVVVLKSGAG
jgi:spermidine synthase